jgi:hypothetical protein
MADEKISELTVASPDETDRLVMVKDPTGTPLSRSAAISALLDLVRNPLQATTDNNGAALVGLRDAGNNTSETTVEGALAELYTLVSALETVTNNLDAAVVLRGTWDASSGSFPGGGTAQAGASYIVDVAGTVDGVAFDVDDRIVAISDNASTSTFAANWHKMDYTDSVLSVAGLTGAITGSALRAAIDCISGAVLSSTSNGEGASLIGLEDASGLTTATTVEGVIAAILTTLDNYGNAVNLDQSEIVLQGGQDVIIYDAGGDSAAARPTQSATKTVIWFNHGSSLPDNLGTYDIAVGGGFGVASVNTQSGTSYDLVLADIGLNVDMNNASANTVTIPADATVAFAVGATISITQLGAGPTTVEGATGVSVNGTSGGSVVINNQYSGCVLRKIGTDSWVIQGDIT